jgi:hypothetical protein
VSEEAMAGVGRQRHKRKDDTSIEELDPLLTIIFSDNTSVVENVLQVSAVHQATIRNSHKK